MNRQISALEKYVGRIVRLEEKAFEALTRRGKNRAASVGIDEPENFFLVATISREMRKLICYGANLRITVDADEVVLV